jgi:hypothetical protein
VVANTLLAMQTRRKDFAWFMSDLVDALKLLRDNARRDPINHAIMPLAGIGILIVAYHYGLPWAVIKAIVCHDLC